MTRDPLRYLIELYTELGPVFRIRALNREMTVLAGIEANQFLSRQGDEHFSSQELFGDFADEMNTEVFLVALDGEHHRHLRKIMRPGFSRERIVPFMGDTIKITQDYVRKWPAGQRVAVVPEMQRIVTEQLGLILIGRPPGDDFDDIWVFLNTVMRAAVLGMWPKISLLMPGYRNAKKRIFELARRILEEHRLNPPSGTGRPADLIDDIIASLGPDGEPYSEESLVAASITPYFAGMDTVANTCSFMLYALLKHPEVLERVTVEVDELFAKGVPTIQDFKEARSLHGAALETLRMYPVAAFTPRTVQCDFEFAGYPIKAGTEVLVANGLTHHLPEYFPNPETFDIDRYHEPRNEHRQAGVFAPYSLGAHTCLGAGLAEVQVMVTLATLLHTVRLRLDPPDYQVQISLAPLPSPGRKFAVEVVEQRNLI